MIRPPAAWRGGARILIVGLAILPATRSASARQDPNAPPPDPNAVPGVEVLTQGPVHEAFAEPVVFDPKPGPVIPKQPPNPVQEVPPDQRPEGDNVQWIPGYWAWDDGRNDFLWVSGIWRIPPPGRQWVPGYWSAVAGGFQWAPGAWVPVAAAADPNVDPNAAGAVQPQQYLPAPPQSLEAGPNIPAPQADAVWAPGIWSWQQDQYLWRPGYWVNPQPNWLWVPAHYVWTPSGYLFVNGYWDHTIARRGTLFAPVYFSQPVYNQPSFAYSPTISLLAGGLLANLFVRPSYGSYYFGDYYASNYANSGIYPWYSFHGSRYGYDPLYAHAYSVNMARNPQWANELHSAYLYRRNNVDARPPHTWAEQSRFVNNESIANGFHAQQRDEFLHEREQRPQRLPSRHRSRGSRPAWRRRRTPRCGSPASTRPAAGRPCSRRRNCTPSATPGCARRPYPSAGRRPPGRSPSRVGSSSPGRRSSPRPRRPTATGTSPRAHPFVPPPRPVQIRRSSGTSRTPPRTRRSNGTSRALEVRPPPPHEVRAPPAERELRPPQTKEARPPQTKAEPRTKGRTIAALFPNPYSLSPTGY